MEIIDADEYLKSNQDLRITPAEAIEHWNSTGKLERYRQLTYKDELEKFNAEGFVVFKNSLENSVIDGALAEINNFKITHIDRWNHNLDHNGFMRRLTNLHIYSDSIQMLFTRNLASRFCDYAFNQFTSVYTSLYFEAGSEQPIHRDTPYFHTVPVNKFFGFWVALEDVTLSNGLLRLIPRGHLSSELDVESIATKIYPDLNSINPNCPKLWDNYQELMYNKCISEQLEVISVEMSRGDTLVWHPMLPHGGSPIIEKKSSRKSIVFHVTPENTPVYQQDAFFNKNKELSRGIKWTHNIIDGRKVALTSNTPLFPDGNA